MDKFQIQDREAGNVIATFKSYDRAQQEIIEYESEDKELGYYVPDFYEIQERN